MVYNQNILKLTKGFTLIEAVMTIAIVGVLAMSGGALMVHLVRDSVYLSNQLNMDMLASDALNIMIEGDGQAKGLRFSREITAIADNQLSFVNQDNQTVMYRLDSLTGQLYRSIDGAAEILIPSYMKAGMTVAGENGKIFKFYDNNENITGNPLQVHWVTLTLIAQSGTGLFSDWQGFSDQSSAIAVRRYQ